jgi:hypothetical protein
MSSIFNWLGTGKRLALRPGMKTSNKSQGSKVKKTKPLSFVLSACLRNTTADALNCRSTFTKAEDYCLDLVLLNINRIDSCQGGANNNKDKGMLHGTKNS